MQDNDSVFTKYLEWNQEMLDLLDKYIDKLDVDQELVKQLPTYAMYKIADYCKRRRFEEEANINEYANKRIMEARNDSVLLRKTISEIDRVTYETLRPIVLDYMAAKAYYVAAMRKNRNEYIDFINSRDMQYKGGKTK